MKYLILNLFVLNMCATCFAQEWQEEATSLQGRLQYYAGSPSTSGNLGFSIRSADGGGWAWQFVDQGNNSYFHIQYPTGYLGLGTQQPSALVHINSSIERESFRLYKNGNSTNYLSLWQGTGAGAIDPIGSGKLYLGYDQVTDVYMGLNGGRIGIGTTDPQSALNIAFGPGDPSVGSAALRIGGVANYPSLEFGIKGLYDGMISTYGNDLHIYAGNWRTEGVPANEDHSLFFYTSRTGSLDWNTPKMMLSYDGNLGIGTTQPTEKLTVRGTIYGKEIKVDLSVPGPDYVFGEDYSLLSLAEVSRFVQVNKHLPEVPSAKEMESNGIKIGEMNMLLLKKIEELTLYVIQLEEQNKKQDALIMELQTQN